MTLENVVRGVEADSADDALERSAVRRVAARLMWFLIVLFLLNSIDRTSLGFAALTMNDAVGLSAQTFGLTVGLFYAGYLVCEIPSNILLARTGARKSLARMAITSGLVTMATAFVTGPISFYFLRFLLGVTQAGYLVGIVLYISYWFPARYRARYNAMFMLAMPVALCISGFAASRILDLNGLLHLSGWQWLFLVEGAPAVLFGIWTLSYLSDRPRDARWLTPEQINVLEAAISRDHSAPPRQLTALAMLKEVPKLLRNPVVLISGMIYLALNFGLLSLTSWTPTVIKGFGLPVNKVSNLTSVVALIAAVAMLIWGRYSDERRERVINTAAALFLGAAGWATVAYAHDLEWALAGFVLAAVGVYAAYAISFTIPQTYVEPANRPVAIAAVGVIGNIGGVFAPIIVGWIRTATGSFSAAFIMIAVVMTAAAIAVLCLKTMVLEHA